MRALVLTALLAAAPAAAETPLSAAEFESIVTGRTLSYASSGGEYGAEEYFDGRRVRWSYLDGDCAEGHWYEAGEQICFVYDTIPEVQCWTFYQRDGRLLAKFENDPGVTELYETSRRDGPLMCLGPEVGV